MPYLSRSEVEMKQTLLTYEEKIKVFESSLDHITKKLKHQSEKLKEFSSNSSVILPSEEFKTLNFNETQIKHIKELLSQE